MQGFQADADKYFDGKLLRLIAHYKDNSEAVIQDGGNSIETLYLRNQELVAAYRHFSSDSLSLFIHTFLRPLNEVRDNTMKNYNFIVLLNTSSIVWGVVVGFFLITLSGLFFTLLSLVLRPLTKRPTKHKRSQAIEPDLGL